ncbi:MAG: TonB-dependent receptor [Thermoanaerobaculaceae bacterium]
MEKWKKSLIALAIAVTAHSPVVAAEGASGKLTVQVQTADGKPAPGVRVTLVGYPGELETDASGKATFDPIPPGRYLIQATAPSGAKASAHAELTADAPLEVNLTLEAATFHEEVTVSAALPERLGESPLAVSVLADDALRISAQASLGETIRTQPGVRSSFYSPGASRPIVRGFGGDRIRILANGQDVGDASDTSPDHGVAMDSWGLERIEVLRGPLALLYASDAIGGVIAGQGPGVPQREPGVPLGGWVGMTLTTNPWQRVGMASLEGQEGGLLWNAAGSKSQGEDYRSGFGRVANSFTHNDQANLGFSWLRPWGFWGLALDQHERRYGSPVEETVHLDLWRRRLQFVAQMHQLQGLADRLEANLIYSEYHHTEFEEQEVATFVANRLASGRITLTHKPIAGFLGKLGLEVSRRTLLSRGEETYLPETKSTRGALFLWEQRQLGAVKWDFALRLDTVRHDPKSDAPERSFTFPSLATSLTWNASEMLKPFVSVSLAGKAPTPEELYSQGPHAATGLYEVGDWRLSRERHESLEVGLLFLRDPVRIQVNAFTSRLPDYIYQHLTGETEDDFSVAQFVQKRAHFWGAEFSAHWDLLRRGEQHLELTLGADAVRASAQDGSRLPRISPARAVAELAMFSSRFRAALQVEKTLPATRIAREETRTPGFTFVNFTLGTRLVGERLIHSLQLKGTNLTDEKALNHTSFFKEKSPLPGRSFALSYQLWF